MIGNWHNTNHYIIGIAGPELLNSYSDERQPVGAAIVERSALFLIASNEYLKY
jgi:hypothetical protein